MRRYVRDRAPGRPEFAASARDLSSRPVLRSRPSSARGLTVPLYAHDLGADPFRGRRALLGRPRSRPPSCPCPSGVLIDRFGTRTLLDVSLRHRRRLAAGDGRRHDGVRRCSCGRSSAASARAPSRRRSSAPSPSLVPSEPARAGRWAGSPSRCRPASSSARSIAGLMLAVDRPAHRHRGDDRGPAVRDPGRACGQQPRSSSGAGLALMTPLRALVRAARLRPCGHRPGGDHAGLGHGRRLPADLRQGEPRPAELAGRLAAGASGGRQRPGPHPRRPARRPGEAPLADRVRRRDRVVGRGHRARPPAAASGRRSLLLVVATPFMATVYRRDRRRLRRPLGRLRRAE